MEKGPEYNTYTEHLNAFYRVLLYDDMDAESMIDIKAWFCNLGYKLSDSWKSLDYYMRCRVSGLNH